ncbi:MAG: acetyl-CoA carboxylase biotin carboxyl carrier protein [Alphaproteobacteria bacterium]|nr:acetyl-CoA carboxylase biotin carboxyl carrier protein [Alphaproteobacteria bacterium]
MARHSIDESVVQQAVKLLEEHGLTELEYGLGRWYVRVSRQAGGQVVAATAPTAAPAAKAEGEAPVSAQEAAAGHPGAVTSPMVGTVYVAPEPGAEPFVKVGDTVGEGQTLLLIEAMKTMNPIRAHRHGRVTQIFAQNASPVEYGEVLIILD